MEVHLITLPKFNTDLLDSLGNTLSSGSVLKFKKVGSFASEYTSSQLHPDLTNTAPNHGLEFHYFFDYCDWYRKDKGISPDTIVVFITDQRNYYSADLKNNTSRTWFSSVYENNIFIYTEIWNSILPERKEYAIAYNIMVNVFQALLKINFNLHNRKREFIHLRSLGCLNDRCNDIEDIIIKLRTGYICDTCIKEARKYITNDMIVEIYQIIKGIRKNFLNFDEIQKSYIPETLTINNKGQFFLGSKEISLTLFQKAIYIFFTRHEDGLEISSINQNEEFEKELIDIYNTLRINYLISASKIIRKQDFEKIVSPIKNLNSNNFLYHKSKLHKKLRTQIGEEKSKLYSINNYHDKSELGDITYLYKLNRNDIIINNFEIIT